MSKNNFQFSIFNFQKNRGYTLIELIVSVGVFAMIMTLVSGSYIVMISVTQRAQGTASGIDNLSFALETMTRNIRTGTGYSSTGSTFSFTNANGNGMTYGLSGGAITQGGSPLTDPSVNVTGLSFALSGAAPASALDYAQPYVVITVSGVVSTTAGKSESFTIRTSAVMRTPDL